MPNAVRAATSGKTDAEHRSGRCWWEGGCRTQFGPPQRVKRFISAGGWPAAGDERMPGRSRLGCPAGGVLPGGDQSPRLLVQGVVRHRTRAAPDLWKRRHDGRNLYVGIVCAEPDMARPADDVGDENGHMPYPWWDNDCAGVMLEPRRSLAMPDIVGQCAGRPLAALEVARRRFRQLPPGGKKEWSLILRIPLNFCASDSSG